MTTRASEALNTITRRWAQTPGWAKLATLLALPLAGVFTLTSLGSYRRWKAMGPGGLPDNLIGYIVQVLMGSLLGRKDTRSLEPYDKPEKHAPGWKQASEHVRKVARTSFLSEPLPRRKGAQAHALRFTAPQRERFASEYQVPKVKAAYLAAWSKLCATNANGTKVQTSALEKRGDALFLTSTAEPPSIVSKVQREIAHIHETDLSAHVTLSLTDAKDVVEKGWGERHALSETVIGLGYTMLYVPRTVEEVDVLIRIMQAGVNYMEGCE